MRHARADAAASHRQAGCMAARSRGYVRHRAAHLCGCVVQKLQQLRWFGAHWNHIGTTLEPNRTGATRNSLHWGQSQARRLACCGGPDCSTVAAISVRPAPLSRVYNQTAAPYQRSHWCLGCRLRLHKGRPGRAGSELWVRRRAEHACSSMHATTANLPRTVPGRTFCSPVCWARQWRQPNEACPHPASVQSPAGSMW